jgi:hypothetical protein
MLIDMMATEDRRGLSTGRQTSERQRQNELNTPGLQTLLHRSAWMLWPGWVDEQCVNEEVWNECDDQV